MALLQRFRVFFDLLRGCFQASQLVYTLLRMWHWALDEQFALSLAISQIISRHTPTLPNSICPHDDESTHSVRLMQHAVVAFKDPHGFNWPMIVNMQKWFMIFNFLIQKCLVPCGCSTVVGGVCIIAIMISRICDQTSVDNQSNYIYYYYDISTKNRIK